MSDITERVAIALFCADSTNPHDPFEWNTGMLTERGREMWRGLARVAIEAMREPTEQMLDSGGWAIAERNGDMSSETEALAQVAWPAMIDAALGKVDA